MALLPGTRLGPYEIVAPIGAGGMGEVYRATDTKLNRDVAIKVLPESFALDGDRVARFTREAQVLASLNHPNIAAIYGIEESNVQGLMSNVRALVMELVEGEDLSAHIARGAMPLAEALPIAKQIADALEAAHEQGIVHRDLKPANIKLRADGTIKVLDFGLAKAMDPAGTSSDTPMNSPTMTARATQMGMIIGTAAYMAPEQARGRAVDRRADVWAFGVVLYEMLTGRRAFDGDDISITLASVLKEDVTWEALPGDLPVPVRRVLRRCLEKDPKRRLSSIGDARLELEEAASPADRDGGATPAPAASGRRAGLPMAVAAAVVVSAVTGVLAWRARAPEPARPMLLSLAPPRGEVVQINVNQPDLAISHDGRRIAYSYGNAGSAFVVRSLDQFGDAVFTDLGPQARSPFYSPDDKWVGYFAAGSTGANARLKKVAASGGVPLEIAEVSGNLRGASWGRDDVIVFGSTAPQSGLLRVSAAGGTPEVLTRRDASAGEVDHFWPALMPDGRHVVFTVVRVPTGSTDTAQRDLAVLDLASRTWRVIRPNASYPKYLATGHLLFATPGGAFAAPFDPVACEFRGDAIRVIDDVSYKVTSGAADFDVSDAGTLAYIAGASFTAQSLAWVDTRGAETPINAPSRSYSSFHLSPDGARAVVVTNDGGEPILQIYDLARGSLTPLTPPNAIASNPVWSRDGRFVYYRSFAAQQLGIFRLSASGASPPEQIAAAKPGESLVPTSVTSDGHLIVTRAAPGADPQILILSLDGAASARTLIAEPGGSLEGQVSPDGRWLAYSVRIGSSGARDVFLRPFPDVNQYRVPVSTDGGSRPVWAANSRAIFYQAPGDGGGVFKVDLSERGQLGRPAPFVAPKGGSAQAIDMPTGGDRVVRIQPILDKGESNELRIVLNWFELLKQRMAGK
ncbi:MAG: serine/threonine-protein kinase [Acidobacteria bacterium]|nr:MAG: serine/threonine-protein kinase [Acidobacteriota bacterium]